MPKLSDFSCIKQTLGKMWWKEKYPDIMADRPLAKTSIEWQKKQK